MKNLKMQPFIRRSLSIGSAIAVTLSLSASAMAGKQRNADQETCGEMGAKYGSRAHTDCMLQQQQRRDNKMVLFLEEQRLHQELGRPAREKLEQKRERRAHEKWHDRQHD